MYNNGAVLFSEEEELVGQEDMEGEKIALVP